MNSSTPSGTDESGAAHDETAGAADSANRKATQGWFTVTMLADLLGVPVSTVRGWERRGLIQPVGVVRRVSYFDFSQAAASRQLARLAGEGISSKEIRRLARRIAGASIAELALTVEEGEIVIRRDGQLIDPDGQRRFEFADANRQEDVSEVEPAVIPLRPLADGLATADPSPGVAELHHLRQTAELREESGDIDGAIEAWRTLHLTGGPRPETCCRLAELLYLSGDCQGAKERYFMALEMDPALVEARASLGCVLLELGETELAIAALRGALDYDPDYPDVHFHLAGALETAGDRETALVHWRRLAELCPQGPWSDEARARIEEAPVL